MDDIDNAFDDIFLAEDRYEDTTQMNYQKFRLKGYNDGLTVGRENGRRDGFQLGVNKGGDIGAEVGFYAGVISILKLQLCGRKDSRAFKVLHTMCEIIDHFPSTNILSINTVEDLNRLRGKFKQLCSLLKLNLDSTFRPQFSF